MSQFHGRCVLGYMQSAGLLLLIAQFIVTETVEISDIGSKLVLYPDCFLKIAATIWKTVWETEPTFLVQ